MQVGDFFNGTPPPVLSLLLPSSSQTMPGSGLKRRENQGATGGTTFRTVATRRVEG